MSESIFTSTPIKNSVMNNNSSPTLDLESDGNTSFLRAARNGQLDKVLEHLKSNIDINTSNANGLNALHLASKDGHVEIVKELLKRGAVVDAATKKGNTALHIASLAGQEEVVKLLVQHGASVNVQSQNGFTPLYMAAQENHDNVVRYLLANGANQSLSTEDGFTPLAVAMQQGHDKVVTVLLENDTRGKVRLPALHIAAKKDDVKAAKLLLENEHNPDVTSKSGFTPLHIASHYGNQAIGNLLIQKGADVNYAAKHNITPLHVAAKWGKTNMVALLLEHGANIESKTRDGLTPLHCAARSGHEQVVDMLLERGAPISSKTKNGLAPLHMAAQGDHVDAARILLYHRAPVDEVTVDYLTALHVAAHCGHVRVAKLLLDRQADANARALNGFTPLHIACKKNRIKVVELLLKHGASIGATTESGLTPLHVASFMGCMNIVIYLLQHDANPDVPTVRGETPLHLAARANQTDIIRVLLRNGAQVDARAREQQTPLHIASRLGNVDIVMLLLQHGAKVDSTTKDMYTALHIAAKEGQDEVAAVLIDNGASLSATTKKGFTPLHLAAKYGHLKVAKLLLQKEAPVDTQGKNGVTPLHVAAHYDHQNVALLLLDKGASPHAAAKNGHTPLHIAARKNQMDIANTLLEYGAKPNAESKAGFTPLHLSAQEGHTDMTSLLIEHQGDPNHHSKNGLTPLHLCAQEDRVPVADILVKSGAEVDAATKGGYTPLHVACHYGQTNMVRFLLAHGANVKATTTIGYTPLHQAAQQGHANIIIVLLENSAQPNAVTMHGQTPLNIAQKLGYITVIETLKVVTEPSQQPPVVEDKYRVVAPEAMHETFMSDSEEEGGEDTLLGDQTYRYLTADEMKSLGDDSLPIDVTRDERIDSNRMVTSADSGILPPQHIEDSISPEHIQQNYVEYIRKYAPDNVDINKQPISIGFLVSFLVDARGGAMRGCRHSGVRVIVPPRCAPSPTRITCRYVRPQRTPHPPPLMEGEALASRVLELGPVGAKFLGPVIIEVPHFAALRGKEREIVILRSDNGESWKEHTVEATDEVLNEVLHNSFDTEDLNQMEDLSSGRITRIVTQDFPQYFAVVSRVRQEVHVIGPEGGMVSSTVVPQVQAVFPQGALTKKIKVGLQAQPIDPELTAKLLGHGVAVSPVVTVEPRRRKFHKAITLSMPAPTAHSQGMINQYSGSAPTLRLLCSITGGTSRAQWEDVTGSTPLTFVNDCVSFTTTVSARFWLMDCRNIGDATKMATELYREAIHVPFMAKFVVFAKRVDPLEARLRVFCMTDDKEDKTLEHQEHFTEVAKSRDVEVLEGKSQYIEFAGNLVPITKSGEQLQFSFRAFRENRLPFSVRVKDQHAEAVGRCLFMREAKVPKGEPPQQPICILNIVLPDDIVSETVSLTDSDSIKRHMFINESYDYCRPDPRLADMSNLLGDDWVPLAGQLGLTTSEINVIKSEYPDSVAKQAQSMLRMWLSQSGNKSQMNTLENALRRIGREDIIMQCLSDDYTSQPITRMHREEIEKYRLKDSSLEDIHDADRSLSPIDKKPDKKKKDTFDKYSAEEKIVKGDSEEDEDTFNKSVTERREQIEKRLSVERTIPASSQRVEIVQEISSIKRQSLVEDKIAEVEKDATKPISKTTKPPAAETFDIKTTMTSDSKAQTGDQKPKVETVKTTVTTETRTIVLDGEPITHTQTTVIPSDRRDSELLEGVTHGLETKKVFHKLSSDEDPKSPKFSKTPPPSPADFISRERAAIIQEWDASKKPAESESKDGSVTQSAEEETIGVLTSEADQLTNAEKILPQPKPRTVKTPDTQLHFTQLPEMKSEKHLSPVRDDLLDEIDQQDTIPSYLERKKFWENVTKETAQKRMSLHDMSPTDKNILTKKRMSLPSAPVPKPRVALQTSHSITESEAEKPTSDRTISLDSSASDSSGVLQTELTKISESDGSLNEHKIMTEYQASYQPPSEQKRITAPTKHREHSDSSESDNDLQTSNNGQENTGYISDSGDVEHYISDSEIEDRVPQIRERQMSVFAPPIATARKTIYERSASLPTEDLYEVSARSVKLRKQYYEEQIKKEMIQEQLTSELEEEPSPERKTLSNFPSADLETAQTEIKEKLLEKVFDTHESVEAEKQTDKHKGVLDGAEIQESKTGEKLELHTKSGKDKEDYNRVDSKALRDEDQTQIVSQAVVDGFTDTEQTSEQRKSLGSQYSVSSEGSVVTDLQNMREDSTSKPDSMEVHVDKSEIEDSEKLAELDQDVTDLETKSLDSLNAAEVSKYNATDDSIPEITVTLSGKQRRISEESDEEVMNNQLDKSSPKEEVESESPVHQPQEQIDDTLWETVESHHFDEKLTTLPAEADIRHAAEKDEDLSSSVREESDLGSEIHQDHSDSYASDRIKSDSNSDIEKIILDSLYQQKIDPEEAKKIAKTLIDEIEAEIQRQDELIQNLEQSAAKVSQEPAVISDYLKQLAETKGLDEREVELVESVLARRQRELAKLARGDTQASSMEITDEDLKYSGGDFDSHVLEQQIGQLEAEKVDMKSIYESMERDHTQHTQDKMQSLKKIDEKHTNETFKSEDSTKFDEHGVSYSIKKDSKMTTTETVKAEKLTSESKDIIIEEDETVSESTTEESEKAKVNIKHAYQETGRTIHGASDIIEISHKDLDADFVHDATSITKSSHIDTDDKVLDQMSTTAVDEDICTASSKEKLDQVSSEKGDDFKKETRIKEDKEFDESTLKREETGIEQFKETKKDGAGRETEISSIKQQKHIEVHSKKTLVDYSYQESQLISTDKPDGDIVEKVGSLEEKKISPVETLVEKHETIKRTSSTDSKSSIESGKSPEDQFSSGSSGKKATSDIHRIAHKGVVLRKTKSDADTSSSSSNLKPDRKSGIEFETYSSSGESHYHSFELDSGRSRPCSSDVEGMLVAGSSEYESALTNQEISTQSHITSTDYQTAVSSLSSKESMKSLDSESSGNLASVEISEASETLIPSSSELEGDLAETLDQQLCDIDKKEWIHTSVPQRQSTELSDSEVLLGMESADASEEDIDEKRVTDVQSKMKRSQEMTFQPEPKILVAESPQNDIQETEEKLGSSLDDGSVLSMSLSSTSSVAAVRTVIELSRADSERLEGSMTISGTSEQLSVDEADALPRSSHENIFSQTAVPITSDMATSTPPITDDLPIESVTLTTASIAENGIQSVSTQVISETHSPIEEQEISLPSVKQDDQKRKRHKRTESSSFVASMISLPQSKVDNDMKKQLYLTETDKFTTVLSFKEGKSDEKKDIDESYQNEEDEEFQVKPINVESDYDTGIKDVDNKSLSRPQSHMSTSDSKQEKQIAIEYSGEKFDSDTSDSSKLKSSGTSSITHPIERPFTSELCEEYEIKEDTAEYSLEAQAGIAKLEHEYSAAISRSAAINSAEQKPKLPKELADIPKEALEKKDSHGKSSSTSSEKSSFEEAEAEAVFNMVAHVSPAHRVKQICPILEDEDAEKHELETRERAQKEYEMRRAMMADQSPGSIPDIKVTQHMTPLVDRSFRYPDLELEEKEQLEAQKSTPETPASNSSKSSEETDQGREYVLDDVHTDSLPEEPESDDKVMTESKSEVGTVVEATLKEETDKETDSPNSDSFEMLEKPDLIDDFVVIEEVAREAQEFDSEGKSITIESKKRRAKKRDEEVEEYLVRSDPTPLTKMTEIKYYPEGSSSDELGFEFEDSPPQMDKKASKPASRDYQSDYDRELEANKRWIEQQFQGDQAAMMAAGYGYEMEFERGPLEDIKEEDINDFDLASSRIGSLGSQKESGGSLGSVKDSYSSTPEYDVLAGRKYFTRSGEQDDISMSSLQEFENLERAMSLENRRYHGSQDSSSNGSFKTRYYASKSGQGDDVSVSSLKEFEGLEKACIAAHRVEVKAKEEEAILSQIDEGQESLASESESAETVSKIHEKQVADSEEEDYEKRMFEIDEIIKQAQSNVERFIEFRDVDKTESLGRGDSVEEVAKIPELDLDVPVVKSTIKVQWKESEDVMICSTDSLDLNQDKTSHHDSTDSLDQRTPAADVMTASTDSIEYQLNKTEREAMITDSIEMRDEKSGLVSSDSLELAAATSANIAPLSDSLDEDGSRIGYQDHSSSSTGKDFSSSVKDDCNIQDQKEDYMLESTESLDPTSSTATHATYQYETDSVFSGSFTSGGSNTMVSSTDTIDPTLSQERVDIAAAVKRVWFNEDLGASSSVLDYVQDSSKPYVTELIEPTEDDTYSHIIHRKVELPPEVRKITFTGPDADERLKQFIEKFNEGEQVEETEEVDASGNVHVKRVVHKRMILKSDGGVGEVLSDLDKREKSEHYPAQIQKTQTVSSCSEVCNTQRPEYPQSQLTTVTRFLSGEEASATVSQDVSSSFKAGSESSEHLGSQVPSQRPVADQHQLSDEMKELLKELERESKQ